MYLDTILSIRVLGQCEMAVGNYQTAEKHLSHVHRDFKRQLGEDHSYTISALSMISSLRQLQGRRIEAVKLAEDCLARSRQILGPEHSITIQLQGVLAYKHYCADQYEAAIESITQASATASHGYPHRLDLNFSLQHKHALILCEMPERYEDAAFACSRVIAEYGNVDDGFFRGEIV